MGLQEILPEGVSWSSVFGPPNITGRYELAFNLTDLAKNR
jgi:hypothetical protein